VKSRCRGGRTGEGLPEEGAAKTIKRKQNGMIGKGEKREKRGNLKVREAGTSGVSETKEGNPKNVKKNSKFDYKDRDDH